LGVSQVCHDHAKELTQGRKDANKGAKGDAKALGWNIVNKKAGLDWIRLDSLVFWAFCRFAMITPKN
jgi:hypothetical protein